MSGRRQCPTCSAPAKLLPLWMVYAELQRLEDGDPLRAAYCLVCWECRQLRQRGQEWQPIDWRRHERSWKAIKRKNEQEDAISR